MFFLCNCDSVYSANIQCKHSNLLHKKCIYIVKHSIQQVNSQIWTISTDFTPSAYIPFASVVN